MESIYIRIGILNGEQVYFSPLENKVLLERGENNLVLPTVEERKLLIDYGLIRIVNNILLGKGGNDGTG